MGTWFTAHLGLCDSPGEHTWGCLHSQLLTGSRPRLWVHFLSIKRIIATVVVLWPCRTLICFVSNLAASFYVFSHQVPKHSASPSHAL